MIPYEALQAIVHAEAGNLEAGMHDRAQFPANAVELQIRRAVQRILARRAVSSKRHYKEYL